ncbi:ACP S-malonyltransferase [uncultured Ferrimonas sp.]|uniref:ACP S-malonyltransferase n=1 Tax=uncultured Ferrimonas sp. TaxID=432640 RepID=UPI00260BC7AF|nr:ACP S-malonyltransferase [uncultured Ferrimonas sp.]
MSKNAFLFPGQGSQAVGMLADVAAEHAEIQQTFAEASAVLGFDLWAMVQDGPAEDLNQTHNTQPALLTASVALYRAYLANGGQAPALMAGHSLGEYSALVCAGAIEFKDAVKLVALRGQLMQQAVPAGVGAMYAIIGLDDDSIAKCCAEAAGDQVVSPVNFNSPGQVVIAGHKDAVERAGAACKEAGAKRALPLPVSVPSHCALMQPAADKLALALEEITVSAPSIPVINNVDVAMADNSAAIKDALVRQLHCPVRWTETVNALAAEDVTNLFEVGPGKVLTGLAKRINKTLTATTLNTAADLSAVS